MYTKIRPDEAGRADREQTDNPVIAESKAIRNTTVIETTAEDETRNSSSVIEETEADGADAGRVTVAITAASYSGNKGAAAMLQSSIAQLREHYGERLCINLMSVYPKEDVEQIGYSQTNVISAKPGQLLFIAFPLAILYWLFRWFPICRKLFLKNPILRAYSQTDLVIDEAGISFVDSRGAIMNTYAFVCMAVPLLMGVPCVKYSQAMGSFHRWYNRFLAGIILPRMSFIAARGQMTLDNLASIGITENVAVCADGAFTMPDSEKWKREVDALRQGDDFYQTDRLIGVSISSVVQKKCDRADIDYIRTMADFIEALAERGYRVLMIANAARIGSKGVRNNDLMVGDAIYEMIGSSGNGQSRSINSEIRWYHEEMTAEKIRELIAGCRILVASRFHAMIAALTKGVPVLLIGWSHKYQEVMDQFELGEYATDFSKLSGEKLIEGFDKVLAEEDAIREKLISHRDEVLESSRKGMKQIMAILDKVIIQKSQVGQNAPKQQGSQETQNTPGQQDSQGQQTPSGQQGSQEQLSPKRLQNISRESQGNQGKYKTIHSDKFLWLTLLMAAFLRFICFLRLCHLKFRVDDFGPLIYPARLAGYDWQGFVSGQDKYYGYGYYWIFAPLFRLDLSAAELVAAISLINSALIALSSAYLYRVLRKYFRMPEHFFTALLAVIPTLFVGDAIVSSKYIYRTDNEIPLYLLCCLLIGLTGKAFEALEGKASKRAGIGLLAGLLLTLLLMVHERAIALVIAVMFTEIIWFIKQKKFLFYPVTFGGAFLAGFLVHRFVKGRILAAFWNGQIQVKNTNAFSDTSLFFLSPKGFESLFSVFMGNWHSAFVKSFGLVCVGFVLAVCWLFHREKKKEADASALVLLIFGVTVFIIIAGLGVRWGNKFYQGLMTGEVVYAYKGLCYSRYYYTFLGSVIIFVLAYLYHHRKMTNAVFFGIWALFFGVEGLFFVFVYRYCAVDAYFRNRSINLLLWSRKNLILTMAATMGCILLCTWVAQMHGERMRDAIQKNVPEESFQPGKWQVQRKSSTARLLLDVAIIIVALQFLQRAKMMRPWMTNAYFHNGQAVELALEAVEELDGTLPETIYVPKDNQSKQKFYLQFERKNQAFVHGLPKRNKMKETNIIIRTAPSPLLQKKGYGYLLIENCYVHTNRDDYIQIWKELGLENTNYITEPEEDSEFD